MFNSLLNAVGFNSLILDIFIILAVVVAGALIFYFLWEAISAAIEKSGKSQKTDDELKFEDEVDENGLSKFSLDGEEKEETVENEVEVSEEKSEDFDEEKLDEIDEEKAEQEKEEAEEEISEEERQNAERRAYLEARRQELLRRMQEESEEESEESAESEETEETEETSETEDAEQNEETEEVEEAEVEQADETEELEAEQIDDLQQEREALIAEKARYEAMVEELEKAKQALSEAQETTVAPTTSVLSGLSLAELKEKLANAEERLKTTEKEFKQCKKEFIPLQKVWATHEKDEKRLRRKEALVARQKVLLYGVNNIADIDAEKAKKLEEDLDLLDGLKLSVQHCEEVMKNNEERYPLLEKMYNVLKLRDEELKSDIAKLQEEIARLESEQE